MDFGLLKSVASSVASSLTPRAATTGQYTNAIHQPQQYSASQQFPTTSTYSNYDQRGTNYNQPQQGYSNTMRNSASPKAHAQMRTGPVQSGIQPIQQQQQYVNGQPYGPYQQGQGQGQVAQTGYAAGAESTAYQLNSTNTAGTMMGVNVSTGATQQADLPRDFLQFQFMWDVNTREFASCGVGQALSSPSFTTAFRGVRLHWLLQLYPHGYDLDCRGYMSLILHYDVKQRERTYEALAPLAVRANTEFFLIRKETVDRALVKKDNFDRWRTYDDQGNGVIKCFPESMQTLRGEGVLNGDWLKLGALIRIPREYFDPFRLITQFLPDESEIAGQCAFGRKLFRHITSGEQRHLSDFVLIARDGTEFFCQKAILACTSTVFSAIFEHPDTSTLKHAEVRELTGPALQEMLHFVYMGYSSDLLPSLVQEVLRGAERYDISIEIPSKHYHSETTGGTRDRDFYSGPRYPRRVYLKTVCELELLRKLDRSTSPELLLLANQYRLPILQNAALDIAFDMWPQVRGTKLGQQILGNPELKDELILLGQQRATVPLVY